MPAFSRGKPSLTRPGRGRAPPPHRHIDRHTLANRAAGGANHESGEAGVVEEIDKWGTQPGGQAEQAAEPRGIAKDGQEVLRVGLLVSEAGGSQRGLATPEGKQAFGG